MARAALGAFVDGAREIAQHGTFGFASRAIPYPQANALFP
jgi:hypothetical protein